MNQKKSFLANTGVSIVSQVVMLFVRFFLRTVFIHVLGTELLGFNATFGSILGLLNLSELGIGFAITYKLYKPFAEEDYETVYGYLSIYRKFYRYIIITVSTAGVLLCPFLPVITKSPRNQLVFISGIFLLQLGKTLATYTLSYLRVILNVQEKNYIVSLVDFSVSIVISLLQLVILIGLENYYLYLVVDIVGTLCGNIFLYLYVKKQYPSIFQYAFHDLNIRPLVKDVTGSLKNVVIVKLGSYILNSTDYLVVSTILGVVSSGFLSNYNMIFIQFQTLILVAMNSVQSIIGNALYTSGKESVLKIVNRFTLILGGIAVIFSPAAFVLADDFITLWLGPGFTMQKSVALFLSVNVALMILSNPISLLFGSLGYYNYDKYVILASAGVNLLLSIVLCRQFGVVGVLIGTTIAVLIYWFSRIYILRKHYFDSMKSYFQIIIGTAVCIIVQYRIALMVDRIFPVVSYWWFVIKGLMIVAMPILFMLLFRRTKLWKNCG